MKIEGTYKYEGIEFDYKAYVDKGCKGDYYTPPSADRIDIEFIGFLPDCDLYECLSDSLIENLIEKIQEDL